MNRNYKVIWNASLNCFMAVAEYAKARGKSSKSSVSSNATINTTSSLSSTRLFRTTTIWLGLIAAGFSMQAIAAPCTGATSVECGNNATVGALNGIAIGKNATVLGSQGIAIGGGSSGQDTTASGDQSIAIGANVVSSGASSIAIGGDDLDTASKTNFDGSISTGALNSGQVNTTFNEYAGRDLLESWDAYGGHTEASGAASIAMGAKARSAGNLATAMGIHSSASGIASSAFGVASSATGQGALALGAGAKSLTQDGVALGSRSVANVAGGAAGFAPTSASTAAKSAIAATNSTNLGAVSIGSAKDGTRQIVNLAAGTNDSDAVNVAQLTAVDNQVITNTTDIGKGIKFNVNNGLKKTFALGEEIKFDTDSNLTTTALSTGDGIKLGLANTINVDKITINNDGPIISKNGIIMGRLINGEFKNRITNLAPGVSPGDAVNKSQLDASKTHYYSVNDNGVAKANYNNDGATGGNSMAAGIAATAGGIFSTAIGTEASAQGYGSTALGNEADATKTNSLALGRQAKATGTNSTALGWEAFASADNSIALGRKAVATDANNIALGREANTSGRNSTALGLQASASANNSMALGTEAKAMATKSIALGEGATATHEGSIALGSGSVADGTTLTTTAFQPLDKDGNPIAVVAPTANSELSVGAVGNERRITNVAAGATDTDAVNVSQLKSVVAYTDDTVEANKTRFYSVNSTDSSRGNYNNDGATGVDSMAAGIDANATKDRAVAMGTSASATGSESTALGSAAQAFANSATAVGFGARADQYGATATGTNSRAQGMYSTAVGHEAEAIGENTAAMGKKAKAAMDGATALGANAFAKGIDATAVGNKAQAGRNSIALGMDANALNSGTVALGTQSFAGRGATVVGTNAKANGSDSTALGRFAKANDADSVALGSFSETATAVGTPNVVLVNRTYSFAGAAPKGTVSVGSVGKERTITNVAAGRISGTSTDAVNGSQLYATNTAVNKNSSDIGLGLDFTGDNSATTVNRKLGEKLTVKGGATTALSDNNIGVVADSTNNSLTVKLAKNIDLGASGSVKMGTSSPFGLGPVTTVDRLGIRTGNALANTNVNGLGVFVSAPLDIVPSVALTSNGLNILNGPSVTKTGIDAGNKKITRVDAGTAGTDAVNVDQLGAAISSNKTKYYSVNSSGGTNDLNEGATGQNAMAMGRNSVASGSQAISIGSSASGQNTTASGEQSIAIGANVVSSGASSIAIGGDDLDAASKANIDGTAESGINDGNVNTTFKAYTGRDLVETPPYQVNTESSGAASIAMGAKALSEGSLSTAIGVRSSSAGVASSAFGMGSSASLDGSVALGAGSTTLTNATTEATMMVGGKSYNVTGHAADAGAQVSVGSAGMERQVKHVAAGAVNENSTDAVNGSQLYATNTKVNEGFGLKAADGNTVMKQLGEQVEVVGSNGNITTKVTGDKIAVALNNNLDLGTTGSVTMGKAGFLGLGPVTTVNSLGVFTGNVLGSTAVTGAGISLNGPLGIPSTTLTTNGLNIIGGPSVTRSGIDAGNKRIIRVSNGIDPTDAVNVSQLTSSATAARTIVAKGTNIATVDKTTDAITGQDTYTVNADGTTASAGSAAVTVTPGTKGADNLTDYAVDLSQVTKDSLVKADNSVQYDGPTKDSVTLGGVGAAAPVALTNVKAGDLSADSTDAVNGSQLYATNAKVKEGFGLKAADGNTVMKQLGEQVEVVGSNGNITTKVTGDKIAVALNNNLDLGTTGSVTMGNTRVSNDGITIVAPSIARTVVLNSNGLNNGGNKITNVKAGEADTDVVNVSQLKASTKDLVDLGLNFTGDDTTVSVNRKLGQKLTIKGGATGDLADNNIGVIADADGNLNVKLAKDLTGLNSASFSDDVRISSNGLRAGNTIVNQSGFTFVSEAGPSNTVMLSSTGLNNGGNVITNVARGDALTDAVNVEQLNEVKQSAADANKGWNVSAQGANTSTVKPSATVDLNNTDGNITVSKTADSNNVSFNLNKDIAIDSVKTGDATINNDGLTIAGGPKFTKNSIDASGNKITNVANGDIEVNSKDAVNGGQLFEVFAGIQTQTTDLASQMEEGLSFSADSGAVINKKMGSSALSLNGSNNITTTAEGSTIKFDLNGNISVDTVTTGNTTVSNNGVTIKNGPSMTADGIYAGNVETGPSMTVSGINAGGKVIANVDEGRVAADSREAINGSQLYNVTRNLGNSINELGYKIGEVEDDANAGISAAMAMSSLPQSNIAGRSMIGGGIASYNGESAVAVGISRVSDNGRWVIKVNGTADTQGNAGGAIGAGFHF